MTRLSEARALAARIHGGATRLGGSPDDEAPHWFYEDLKRHFVRFGITRVGDLTGLDRIGLPVWFACRPNSCSLAVSQGKGMSDGQARITAVMEAIENAIAEESDPHVTERCTLEWLERKGRRAVPFDRMTRCVPDELDRQREYAWIPGMSLITGETCFAPYELIGLDLRADSPWDHVNFRMSSIGLAAGTSLAGATLHALLEVVENHATAALDMFGAIPAVSCPLAHRKGWHAPLDEAVTRVRKGNGEVNFVEVKADIGLPVVGCFIQEQQFESGAGYRVHAGFACRIGAADAALAALLEAAQSRLTDISGARDDIVEADYRPKRRMYFSDESDLPDIAVVDQNGAPHPVDGAEAGLRHVLRQIRRAKDADVYVFPLGGEDQGVRVVRVLATQFDASTDDGVVKLGSDALARFLEASGAAH